MLASGRVVFSSNTSPTGRGGAVCLQAGLLVTTSSPGSTCTFSGDVGSARTFLHRFQSPSPLSFAHSSILRLCFNLSISRTPLLCRFAVEIQYKPRTCVHITPHHRTSCRSLHEQFRRLWWCNLRAGQLAFFTWRSTSPKVCASVHTRNAHVMSIFVLVDFFSSSCVRRNKLTS